MRYLYILSLVSLIIMSSCTSARVAAVDTKKASDTKTFAFNKKGVQGNYVDRYEKRAILKSIERVMEANGFTKSDDSEVLVTINTKSYDKLILLDHPLESYNSRSQYDVGCEGILGSGTWIGGIITIDYAIPTTSKINVLTLFIDLIDTKNKEIVWEGSGTADLEYTKAGSQINKLVTEIMNTNQIQSK